MPTLDDLKNDIIALTEGQEGIFNNNCESVLHTTVESGSRQQIADAITLAGEVDALNATDLDTLIVMLPNSRKGSRRPC